MDGRHISKRLLPCECCRRAVSGLWVLVGLCWPLAACGLTIGLNPVDRAGNGFASTGSDVLRGQELVGLPVYQMEARCWNNLLQCDAGSALQLRDNGNCAAYDSGVWAMWRSASVSTSTPTLPLDATSNYKMMWGSMASTDETNDDPLPADFFNRSANQPLIYVRGLSAWLSKPGQPAGANSYAVVVYVDGDGTDRIGEYWLQRVPLDSLDPPSALGPDLSTHVFVHETGTDFIDTFTRVPLSADSETHAATGNYILWQGLTADRFVLRTEARLTHDGVKRAVISGVQIVAEHAAMPTVTMGATDAAEPLTSGTFTITRSGSQAAPLTVYYSVGGTATPGVDYYAEDLPGSATIPVGSASVTLTVRPKADDLIEGPETITIAPAARGDYLDGTPNAMGTTMTVADETRPLCLDADHDGDIDQADFAVFQRCYSGWGHRVGSNDCLGMDVDGDACVTAHDLEIFLRCVSGPGVAASADCLSDHPG